MAYLLPRILIVAIAWGITCILISAVSPSIGVVDYCLAAMSWALAGAVYVSYMRKLRRQRHDLHLAQSALPRGVLSPTPAHTHLRMSPRDLDQAA